MLSLLFPGIGDWYLGHHVLAALKIAVASIGWMWLIGLRLKSLTPAPEIWAASAAFFLILHVGDALATLHRAGAEPYPVERRKPGLAASLRQFATVTGVFLLAVFGAVVVNETKAIFDYESAELERQQRLAASPAVQQARAVQAARVEQITVATFAERIAATTSDWSVVALYSIRAPHTQTFFPQLVALHHEFHGRGVDFKLYSIDDERDLPDLPVFLARHQAEFPPARLMPWVPGELSAAIAPAGIRIGAWWDNPLFALLDRQGKVVWQAEGVVHLNELKARLDERVHGRGQALQAM